MPGDTKKGKKKNRVKVQVVEEKPESEELNSKTEKQEEAKNIAISAENVDVDIKNAEKVEIEEEDQTPPPAKPNEAKTKEEPDDLESPDKIPFWVLFLSFLIGVSLGAGLIGGIFYYQSSIKNLELAEEAVLPTSSPKISGTPEATPTGDKTTDETEIDVDLAGIKVQILNGSGIGGEAAKAEALLNNAGFTDTTTGNAKSYGYTATEISYKDDVDKRAFSPLEDALDVYVVERTDVLPDSSSYDIIVIVGQDKS